MIEQGGKFMQRMARYFDRIVKAKANWEIGYCRCDTSSTQRACSSIRHLGVCMHSAAFTKLISAFNRVHGSRRFNFTSLPPFSSSSSFLWLKDTLQCLKRRTARAQTSPAASADGGSTQLAPRESALHSSTGRA